jgi:hypothetical protein
MGQYAVGSPPPPSGWGITYAHDFTSQGMGDWVVQPGSNAPVKVFDKKGAEFGLGITLTAESQWSEVISSDAVVGDECFVQALLFIPLAPNGEVANWPAWWTTGLNWPEDGEIDILEGQSGFGALQTHYGTLLTNGNASENSNSASAPAGVGNWLTVSLLRTPTEATAYYNKLKLGPVPAPFTENHQLIFQNQSYSAEYANNFGPLLTPSTAYLSRCTVWAP